jgi:tRNA(adenine34) deaminase
LSAEDNLNSFLDEQLMRIAILEANKSLFDVPVGALIVSPSGEILAKSHNFSEEDNDILGHAEIRVIKRVTTILGTRRLSDCSIYVTLEPCPLCAMLIREAQICRLVFGAWNKKSGGAGSKYDLLRDKGMGTNEVEVKGGILETECATLLTKFFGGKR